MQSDRQHIDDFFRAKEEAWDAGSADLQQHWQQMLVLKLMDTSTVDSKPAYYRLMKLLSGVVALAVLVAVLVILSKRQQKEVVVEKKPQQTEALNAVVAPSLPQNDTVAIIPLKPIPDVLVNQIETDQTDSTVSLPEAPVPDAATLMSNFYTAIKKESQVFSIPANRDTTITGKEGTLLTIKANTFGNSGRITITMTEYYQYDDILAAKLNTVSGGKQLVSGGMLHLQAEVNGKPVQISPGRTIELKMPTDNFDQDMQLFLDAPALALQERQSMDTMAAGANRDGSRVNWIPAGQSQRLFGGERASIEVVDLSAAPYRVSYRKNKTVGKFFYDEWEGFDEKALKEELKKRYGAYYDKIKLRKAGRRENRETIQEKYMDFATAAKAGLLVGEDSIRFFKKKAKDSAYYSRQLKLLKYYRFEVSSLGWINCDRFLRESRPLSELTINLGEGYEAKEFVTHLVFDRLRSVINGYYSGSQVHFRDIPENEPVQLVSVGTKDGKVVSTITPYIVGKPNQKTPVFEETTPEAFRQKLEVLNKPNAPQ